MIKRAVNSEEAKWQRRSDARVLAEAEQIKADKERYQGAILGAKEIAGEEIARVKGIAKIAGMKTPQTPKDADPEPTTMSHCDRRGYRNPACIGKL